MKVRNYFNEGVKQHTNLDEELYLTAMSILRRLEKGMDEFLHNDCKLSINSRMYTVRGTVVPFGLERIVLNTCLSYSEKIKLILKFLENKIKASNIQLIMERIVDNYDDFEQVDLLNLEYKINQLMGLDKYSLVFSDRNNKGEIVFHFRSNDYYDNDVKTLMMIDERFNMVVEIPKGPRCTSLIDKNKFERYDIGSERSVRSQGFKSCVRERLGLDD